PFCEPLFECLMSQNPTPLIVAFPLRGVQPLKVGVAPLHLLTKLRKERFARAIDDAFADDFCGSHLVSGNSTIIVCAGSPSGTTRSSWMTRWISPSASPLATCTRARTVKTVNSTGLIR